jgi:uncharacterized protein YbjT (DUF2867 family)
VILVVGATGMLGGAIVRGLVERDEPVRALVRDASGETTLMESSAEPVWGDLKDPASLAAACNGATTVITTANSAGRGGPDNVENRRPRGQPLSRRSGGGIRSQALHFRVGPRQGSEQSCAVPASQGPYVQA